MTELPHTGQTPAQAPAPPDTSLLRIIPAYLQAFQRLLLSSFYSLFATFRTSFFFTPSTLNHGRGHTTPRTPTLAKSQLPTRLSRPLPPGSWDSHMHILDPLRYPLAKDALYTPQPYTLAQALAFEGSLGISTFVVVQPSIYGTDNSCLLAALEESREKCEGTARAVGVVSFDPDLTSLETLRAWHRLGVRGVRINLQSTGKTAVDGDELACTLRKYADVVRVLHWVLQVYVPLHLVDLLLSVVPDLGVRFCIDHIGHPLLPSVPGKVPDAESEEDSKTSDPYALPGFSSLIKLLEGGTTFVKLSAPYRISGVPGYVDLQPVVNEILRVAGRSRVVFATDWPHTRYEGLDICPWIEQVLDWCADDSDLAEHLFRKNAEALWRL
jgi:predicted TIM-barrel fold metal-dependent hydrolase